MYMMAVRWARCVAAGQHWGEVNRSQYLEVRYEDLVDEPERELRRVCRFIGEEFTTAMLTYYEENQDLQQIPPSDRGHHQNVARPLMKGNHGKWRTEMDATSRYIFEAEVGSLLRQLGYPVAPSAPSAMLNTYLTVCRLRVTLGRTRAIRALTAVPYWQARRAVRNLFLIDNEHYRDSLD